MDLLDVANHILQVPSTSQSLPALKLRTQASDQVPVRKMALVTPVMQGSAGVFLAPSVPPQAFVLDPRMSMGFVIAMVGGLEVCRLRRAKMGVPPNLMGPLEASPAWVVAKAAHHYRYLP